MAEIVDPTLVWDEEGQEWVTSDELELRRALRQPGQAFGAPAPSFQQDWRVPAPWNQVQQAPIPWAPVFDAVQAAMPSPQPAEATQRLEQAEAAQPVDEYGNRWNGKVWVSPEGNVFDPDVGEWQDPGTGNVFRNGEWVNVRAQEEAENITAIQPESQVEEYVQPEPDVVPLDPYAQVSSQQIEDMLKRGYIFEYDLGNGQRGFRKAVDSNELAKSITGFAISQQDPWITDAFDFTAGDINLPVIGSIPFATAPFMSENFVFDTEGEFREVVGDVAGLVFAGSPVGLGLTLLNQIESSVPTGQEVGEWTGKAAFDIFAPQTLLDLTLLPTALGLAGDIGDFAKITSKLTSATARKAPEVAAQELVTTAVRQGYDDVATGLSRNIDEVPITQVPTDVVAPADLMAAQRGLRDKVVALENELKAVIDQPERAWAIAQELRQASAAYFKALQRTIEMIPIGGGADLVDALEDVARQIDEALDAGLDPSPTLLGEYDKLSKELVAEMGHAPVSIAPQMADLRSKIIEELSEPAKRMRKIAESSAEDARIAKEQARRQKISVARRMQQQMKDTIEINELTREIKALRDSGLDVPPEKLARLEQIVKRYPELYTHQQGWWC